MNFLSMTQDEQDLAIAQNLHGRETEWFHYDLNVRNYDKLLSQSPLKDLPAEWPAELVQYRKLNRDQTVMAINDEQVLGTVTNLQLRDRLQAAKKAESLERGRAEMYRNNLATCIPQPRLTAAIAKAKIARDAQA